MAKRTAKKILFSIITAAITFIGTAAAYAAAVDMVLVYDGIRHTYSAEEIGLTVLGTELTGLDVPPVSLNGRTYVPARAIGEAIGAEVQWNAASRQVYIVRDGSIFVLEIDSSTGLFNGSEYPMDVAPKIINDRTMLPARYIAEVFGFKVDWDNASRHVTIRTESSEPESPDTPQTGTGGGTVSSDGDKPIVTGAMASEINISGVEYQGKDAVSFTITTSGEIAKYSCFTLGGERLVFDIYYATLASKAKNVTFSDNAFLSAIRMAQNQTNPDNIARVVFDLKSEAPYDVKLADDKKSISVTFEENTAKSLSTRNTASTDIVNISFDSAPVYTITELSDPYRVVIDIANTKSSLRSTYNVSDCEYIEDIRTSQFSDTVTRVVLQLASGADYDAEVRNNTIIADVFKSTVENVSYNHSVRRITLAGVAGVSTENIVHKDDYLAGEYTLTLPGDYSSILGYGRYRIGDDYISNIYISTENGKTSILLRENSIITAEVSQRSEGLCIDLLLPREKYQTIVVIDPGHGGSAPGNLGMDGSEKEKDVNLDLALRLITLLENSGLKVYATRYDDSYVDNYYRAELANEVGDIFVSIHQNAFTSGTANGTEVLYYTHSNETGSGKVTSRLMAEYLQKYLVDELGTVDRGIKSDPQLIVLNQTKIPAVLVEVLFMTNADDAAKLEGSSARDNIAKAMYMAISDVLSQYSAR